MERALETVATSEGVPLDALQRSVDRGECLVISSRRPIEPVGIGRLLRAKFATIVGTSSTKTSIDEVVTKARTAVECGAAVVHNGSSAGNVEEVGRVLLETISVPLASPQPISLMGRAAGEQRRFVDVAEEEFLEQVQRDIEAGFEVLPIPSGVTQALLAELPRSGRLMPCCSKCGSLISAWMLHNGKENPYRVHWGEIVELARRHGTTLSVVAAYRSGCLHDALDSIQQRDLRNLEESVRLAREAGVRVKVISGGHIPIHQVGRFFEQHRQSLGVPVLAFGPQTTDISIGYDHITSAMGQIQALTSGADMLFSVTPAEHLSMPTVAETRTGCVVAQLVCHSANVARGFDRHRDDELSRARENFDWVRQADFAFDESIKERLRASRRTTQCDVCGEFCAYHLMRRYRGSPT